MSKLKKGDTVFIKAVYSPGDDIREEDIEGNMLRCVTYYGGEVVWVQRDEVVMPDRCDGVKEE